MLLVSLGDEVQFREATAPPFLPGAVANQTETSEETVL